jgi:predicted Zn-dependent peptidase
VPATLNLEVLAAVEDHPAVETAILSALEQLAAGRIDLDDLALAKKKLRTQWYRTVADADALAFEIGHFQTMDRWQTLQTHLQQRDATDAAQIARLAQRYFDPDNRVVGTVRPRTSEEAR